jgi:hypothetical protein
MTGKTPDHLIEDLRLEAVKLTSPPAADWNPLELLRLPIPFHEAFVALHRRMHGRSDLAQRLARWAWTHEQLRISWDGKPCTALMIAMSEYLDTVDMITEVINRADQMLEAGESNDPPLAPMLASRFACGCLRNSADAHRVGCPDHPEGVRGS